MSQNHQAASDRAFAQHDDEVNAKAEFEIAVIGARLDQIRDTTWAEPVRTQRQQLELLTERGSRLTEC